MRHAQSRLFNAALALIALVPLAILLIHIPNAQAADPGCIPPCQRVDTIVCPGAPAVTTACEQRPVGVCPTFNNTVNPPTSTGNGYETASKTGKFRCVGDPTQPTQSQGRLCTTACVDDTAADGITVLKGPCYISYECVIKNGTSCVRAAGAGVTSESDLKKTVTC
jgi:hypothetical protein